MDPNPELEQEPAWVTELRADIAEVDRKIEAAKQEIHRLEENRWFLLKRLPAEAPE